MRRKRRKDPGIILLFTVIIKACELFAVIVSLLLKLCIRLILLTYDAITIYTSKYKDKSGNGFFKTYFTQGNYGEFNLYRRVCRIFGKENVLTNIYLDNVNTETTEIDVLAISTKGIYVFEMKDYAGYIYGSQNDPYWMQVFNKNAKYRFFNPLRQNYAHQKALENYLEVNPEIIMPIIVFSNRSKLSKITIDSSSHVYRMKDAVSFTRMCERKRNNIIDENSKSTFLNQLTSRCNVSDEIKQKHIEDVKELVEVNNR